MQEKPLNIKGTKKEDKIVFLFLYQCFNLLVGRHNLPVDKVDNFVDNRYYGVLYPQQNCTSTVYAICAKYFM